MNSLVAHMRALWGPRWLVPLGLALLHLLLLALGQDLSWTQLVVSALLTALAYGPGSCVRFLREMSPFVLVVLGFELVLALARFGLGVPWMLGCELRSLEQWAFTFGQPHSVQDYFLLHHDPLADVVLALGYTLLAPAAVCFGVYLFWVDRQRLRLFAWSVALASAIAFALWLLLPSAPPWYLRQFGCILDRSVPPNPAALERIDELLGVVYYRPLFARRALTLASLPSLHGAYPLIGLLLSWKGGSRRARLGHLLYVLWLAVASLYWDQHWSVDLLAGWLVAGLSVTLTSRWLRGRPLEPLDPSPYLRPLVRLRSILGGPIPAPKGLP